MNLCIEGVLQIRVRSGDGVTVKKGSWVWVLVGTWCRLHNLFRALRHQPGPRAMDLAEKRSPQLQLQQPSEPV